MNNFYVYIYFDPRINGVFKYDTLSFEYEPFYIGKGKGKRLYVHLNQDKYNLHKLNKIKGIKRDLGTNPIIEIFENNLTEEEAFEKEKLLIKIIGRKDQTLGPLVNYTDGGDGASNPNAETRKKISERMKGSNNPNYNGKTMTSLHVSNINKKMIGDLNNFYGKKHTVETKLKIAKVRKNESEETKRKRSESFKQTQQEKKEKWCKKYEFISPKGTVYLVNDGLSKFVKFHGLSEAVVNKICNDSSYVPSKGTAVGWKARRL